MAQKWPRDDRGFFKVMKNLFDESLRGVSIKLVSRPGVFSPKGVDDGTKLLVNNLEFSGKTLVADLGSGSGVLGIFLAKLNPQGHIHLLDDHLRAVGLSKENVELNDLRNVEVYLSDLFSAVADRTYNQIFSNPPQQLGNEFLEEVIIESFKHLKPGGELWLVVKKNIKPVIERFMGGVFPRNEVVAHGREHVVIKGVRDD